MRPRWTFLVALAACGGSPEDAFSFEKHVIDPAFRSEGVAVFDVNKDGAWDIVSEDLWYEGPGFAPHEIQTPRTYDPLTEYAHSFALFHRDIDGNGFEDLIVFAQPGDTVTWCANPSPTDRHWDCYPITDASAGESPFAADLFQTGELQLVLATEPDRRIGWMTPGRELDQPWVMHAMTPTGFPQAERYEHGLGFGDLNRDLKYDVITGSGWLEQPDDPDELWPWHPATICPNNCSHMHEYDIDGDGLHDIVGTSPHGYGAWWFQQVAGAPGTEPTFVSHEIDSSISQLHAAKLFDLDGDRVPELITGKRWYAHFTADPGALEPAYLVVYQMSRSAAGVEWKRYDVDDDSGVGTQFEIQDVNLDGHWDIVVSNKKGIAWFEQRPR